MEAGKNLGVVAGIPARDGDLLGLGWEGIPEKCLG